MPTPDEPCAACPVPPGQRCRSDLFPFFCDWAASGHATRRLHVVNRSAIAEAEGDGPHVAFPPLLVQAGNFTAAAGRFVASGGATATPEERERRLAICRSNECGRFVGGRCAQCGCLLGAKASMLGEHCPLPEPYW